MLRRRRDGAKEAVRDWLGWEGRDRDREAEGRFIALSGLGCDVRRRGDVLLLVEGDVWRLVLMQGATVSLALRRERGGPIDD